jgi:hypothetical protein
VRDDADPDAQPRRPGVDSGTRLSPFVTWLFAIGALGFAVFVFGLRVGYCLEDEGPPTAGAADRSV